MLPDHITQLLTAFVDGELGQRQREAVMRILHQSSEARETLRQLQENAHRLKQLPKRKVEPSLVGEILQAIAEQQRLPKQPARSKVRRRVWKPYVAAGLAASLLLAVAGLVYWKAVSPPDGGGKDEGPVIAKGQPEKKNESIPVPLPSEKETPAPRKAPNPLLASMVDGTFGSFGAPVPPERIFIASFSELKQEGAKTGQLKHELNRDKAVQIDVIVKNNSIAMERLKSALHDRKINIIVDPDADKSLKKKKPDAKVEYWVYADNLTTNELTQMLQELSLNDTKGKKNEPSPYENLKVLPLAKNEKKQLASKLGIDPSKMDLGAKGNEKMTPPADWERAVVLLPTVAGAKPSEQVRQFVQKRRTQGDGVQVLIKIHQN